MQPSVLIQNTNDLPTQHKNFIQKVSDTPDMQNISLADLLKYAAAAGPLRTAVTDNNLKRYGSIHSFHPIKELVAEE